MSLPVPVFIPPAPQRPAHSPAPALIDPFGRRIDYLRISVTDRCDLRCRYCLPEGFKGFEEPADWLTHEEMARLVGLFVALGVSKLRITGGEPLTRRGVAALAARIGALPGVTDLAMSTNGTRLAAHAAALREAGVRRLNVSLDTLDPAEFREIAGRDCLNDVLEGLDAARRERFDPVKINCVVHRGTPEERVERLLHYTLAHGFILRLIEPMPIGATGRRYEFTDLNELGGRLAARHGLVPTKTPLGPGPARYWVTGNGTPALGVITPMSQHFCAACNRVRLTVNGTLHLCLGQENRVPLGHAMRAGADDAELRRLILAGIAAKPERHEFLSAPRRITRVMAQTGG